MTYFNISVAVKQRRDNKSVITQPQKPILINKTELISSTIKPNVLDCL